MIFSCDRCGRRYSVPDERVRGRAFRVTCKACGHVIQVAASAPSPASSEPRAAPPAPPPRQAPPAPPPPPPRVELPMPPFDAAAPSPFATPPSADDPFAEREEAPPPEPPPLPPPEPDPSAEPERTLTTAEIDWLSRNHGPVPGAARRPPHRGPGILRIALVAGVLGVVGAGAVALFWPSIRRAFGWDRPAATVAVPAQPAPEAKPAPPPPAEPVPAPAPEPAAVAEPVPATQPARAVSSRARFEPGTVKVARARRRDAPALSKKDRRLLDLLERKKDAVAPPEPVETLDLDTGSLDAAAVERVVEESQGAFSGCISRNARAGQEARATLLLTVDATGAVTYAWIAEAELAESALGRCLATAGRRLVFPAFQGPPVDVSVPLWLEAR